MPVACYNCCSQGFIKIQGSFENSYFSNADTVRLIAQVENSSSIQFKLAAKCWRTIELKYKLNHVNSTIVSTAQEISIPANTPFVKVPIEFKIYCGDLVPTCIG